MIFDHYWRQIAQREAFRQQLARDEERLRDFTEASTVRQIVEQHCAPVEIHGERRMEANIRIGVPSALSHGSTAAA